MTDAKSHQLTLSSVRMRAPARFGLWAAAPLLAILIVFIFDRGCSSSRVLRGVWLSSTALSGLSRDAAERAISEFGERLAKSPLHVRIQDAAFEIDPKSVGYRLDVER